MKPCSCPWIAAPALALILLAAGTPARAGDGVVELNQARAEAGGVSLLDLPGFPIVLTDTGSYRLTSDLRVPDAVNAIGVDSGFVTIDLNGFGIYGPCAIGSPACSPGGSGRGIDAPVGLLTVRNGFVLGTNDDCIRVGGASRIVDVTVFNCGGDGIEMGDGGLVRSSEALFSEGAGLRLGSSTIFEGNTSRVHPEGSRVGGIATGGNYCDDGRCTRDGRRRFYVSQGLDAFTGSQARQACVAGFHMAFFSEIRDVSALVYDGTLGFSSPAGSPAVPTARDGWIRTGFLETSAGNPVAEPNCVDYTTNAGNGTVVRFESRPNTGTNAWSPWTASLSACSTLQWVWCIED